MLKIPLILVRNGTRPRCSAVSGVHTRPRQRTPSALSSAIVSALSATVRTALVVGALLPGQSLRAQSEDTAPAVKAPIEVMHTPPADSSIPPLGSLVRITIALSNTLDIETKVRLVGSKDGRFIDIAFPRGALDTTDKPSFSIDVPSPVAMMTYQFIVHQKDGSLTASRKFLLKRDCIQNFSVHVSDDKRTTAFRREVASLITQAHMLERDNKSLETSLKLLEDIKTSLTR